MVPRSNPFTNALLARVLFIQKTSLTWPPQRIFTGSSLRRSAREISTPVGLQLLAGFDHAFGFAKHGSVDENDILLFRSGVEEVGRHREGILLLRNSVPHVPGGHFPIYRL